MFEQQMEFRVVVKNRDEKVVEECARKLDCPVIGLDGTLLVEQNLMKIIDNLNAANSL